MSKYTTEVRYICEYYASLSESADYTSVNEIISKSRDKIFSFDYPIFDENYRTILETKILKRYYTREIGEETVGLWKLRLDTRMNEIMPYYNKLYDSELIKINPLYTTDLKRTKNIEGNTDKNNRVESEGKTTNDKTENTVGTDKKTGTEGTTGSNDGTVYTENNKENSSASTDIYSDTPQGTLSNMADLTYLTNARKISDNGSVTGKTNTDTHDDLKTTTTFNTTNSKTNNVTILENNDNTNKKTETGKIKSVEDYIENVVGYENVPASDLILKYRNSLINIDVMIIEELSDLFMNLW